MAYFPADAPLPDPDRWELAFWDHCNRRSLRFQCCAACGRIRHPPLPLCPSCGSANERWVEATDDAELFTFTIVHLASHPALAAVVPYNAAVVVFPALQSVRLATNVVQCPNESLRIGMPLTLVWEEARPGRWLPRFRPKG